MQKFPIVSNIKQTLQRWRVELVGLADTETNVGELFIWKDWVPTFTASGTMTWTTINNSYAKYINVGKVVFFTLTATGTTGGVASTALRFTVPINKGLSTSSGVSGIATDPGNIACVGAFGSDDRVDVYRYDGANWGLGAARGVTITGFYHID